MDSDTIIANIEKFFSTASAESIAEIEELLHTPSVDDDVLGAYFDGICEDFATQEEPYTSDHYISDSVSLDSYIFAYEDLDFENSRYEYTDVQSLNTENCEVSLSLNNQAA